MPQKADFLGKAPPFGFAQKLHKKSSCTKSLKAAQKVGRETYIVSGPF
jgi:hypothetical protein